MPLQNLPGIEVAKNDGNLVPDAVAAAPVVLILGTATKGPTGQVYSVLNSADAVATFGSSGTLIRGMAEAFGAGATNVHLLRVGAKSARLRKFISSKVNITTVQQNRYAGTDFEVQYTAATGVLVITRARQDGVAITPVTVYSADAGASGDPVVSVNTGEVIVEGTWLNADGVDIASGTDLKDVPAIGGDTTSKYHDGTDGTDLSRMELYEELEKAYSLLRDQIFDVIVPMNVYLDDKNIVDTLDASIPAVPAQTDTTVYPTAGASNDYLGKVFFEEFEGELIFFWNFSKTDAVADIVPQGYGSSSTTLKSDGSALAAADFHEVNFAYQAANFCCLVSEENQECHAVVGVKAPVSTSLKDLAAWLGKAPVANAQGVITTNGTGLLGNKFMAGRLTSGDVPGHTIDGVDGKLYGGFIKTDTGFINGVQLKDDNSKLVDLGKYLSVVSGQALLSNFVNPSYTTTGAAVYAGMVSKLPADSAPTNKVIQSVGLDFTLRIAKVDALAGMRYVHFHAKPKGVVVSDAPTASRPESDYTRLSTNRIVKATIDALRAVADPYLGEGLSGARMAALDTALESVLNKLQRAGILKRYDKSLTATPDEAVLGQAKLRLTLVPAFELRELKITVALAKQ